MAMMMTARGKARDYCCPGHSPKALAHGTERAREKVEWNREVNNETAPNTAPTPSTPAAGIPTQT